MYKNELLSTQQKKSITKSKKKKKKKIKIKSCWVIFRKQRSNTIKSKNRYKNLSEEQKDKIKKYQSERY